MSRKYLNDRWCIRCGRKTPTPYLKKNYALFQGKKVLDCGCGNGRNSVFMREKGLDVVSIDMAGPFGEKIVLGKDPIPYPDHCFDTILCNYVFMFLNPSERKYLAKEIKRVAKDDCSLMVELYAAKDSECKDDKQITDLQKELFDTFGWKKVRYSKNRFIIKKETK